MNHFTKSWYANHSLTLRLSQSVFTSFMFTVYVLSGSAWPGAEDRRRTTAAAKI